MGGDSLVEVAAAAGRGPGTGPIAGSRHRRQVEQRRLGATDHGTAVVGIAAGLEGFEDRLRVAVSFRVRNG